MRVCVRCGEGKSEAEYYDHPRAADRKFKYCKSCHKLGGRQRDRRIRARLQALKVSRGCVTCGFSDHPAALHFHHRDPATKTFILGSPGGRSRARLDAEIAKCDVMCANCHAVLHCEEGRA